MRLDAAQCALGGDVRKESTKGSDGRAMSLKDILVYLDPSADTDDRLKAAIALAASHGAALTGVDACSDAAFVEPWLERAASLQDYFESAIKAAGVKGAYHGAERSRRNGPHHYAHYVDLILAPPPDSETRDLVMPGVPEEVLLTAGVPVMLLPHYWRPGKIGDNIVIAWKSSREATRAVRDAMPLLLKARKVVVFTYAPQSDTYGGEADLAVAYLQRHGVAAQASTWPGMSEMSAVDALFACLDTQDADLIVSGAYGHSRLLEGLFGGVSLELSRQTTLPVLMSH
jgi:nucleotide-binding universal stress UspA family protein